MEIHYHQAHIQQACCTVLGNLMLGEAEEAAAEEMAVLLTISDAMKGHPHHAGVQAQACWALSRVCASHDPNKDEARQRGLLQLVLTALRAFGADPTVQKHGYWALVNLTHGDAENQTEVGRLGVLRDIKQAMADRAGDVSSEYVLLEQAFWALITNLTFSDKQNRDLARRLGLLDVADSAMQEQQRNASPEEQGLWAVRGILVAPRADERASLAALEEVKAVMAGGAGWELGSVQQQCAAAVWSLTMAASVLCKEAAARLGLLGLLRSAMETHRTHAGVQVRLCRPPRCARAHTGVLGPRWISHPAA